MGYYKIGHVWTPWGDELFRFDGDHVQLYDSTHISSAILQSRFDIANRTPSQPTVGAMPAPSVTADFRGHGAINFGAGQMLKTGTWSSVVPFPSTHYYVAKLPASLGATNMIIDGLTATRQATYALSPNKMRTLTVGPIISVGNYSGGTIIVGCSVFNTTGRMYLNSTTEDTSAAQNPMTPTGLTIGNTPDGIYPFLSTIAMVAVRGGEDPLWFIDRTLRYLGDQYGKIIT